MSPRNRNSSFRASPFAVASKRFSSASIFLTIWSTMFFQFSSSVGPGNVTPIVSLDLKRGTRCGYAPRFTADVQLSNTSRPRRNRSSGNLKCARAFAASQGWLVADEHIFIDDGHSGAEFERRPALQRLLSMLSPAPRFTRLVVSEQKTLGRELAEAMYLKTALRSRR